MGEAVPSPFAPTIVELPGSTISASNEGSPQGKIGDPRSFGKTKDFIGARLTHDNVAKMSEHDVEK